jgi:hypothetical protein
VVDDLADRLRRFGNRQWREPLGENGETAADVVYALVVACATVQAELSRDRPAGAPLVPDRPPYDAALADRLAVTGRDLAEAVAMQEQDGEDSAGVAVLAGLLVTAKVLRLPRNSSLVERIWVALSPAGSAAVETDATGDGRLDLIARRWPGVRQLRVG